MRFQPRLPVSGFRGPVSLRSRLIILIITVVVPPLVFSAWMIALFARNERTVMERGLNETARALRQTTDKEFESTIATLEALATSEQLEKGDLEGFYRLCARVLPSQPDWKTVLLFDATGREVFNLARPFGAPLQGAVEKKDFASLLRTEKPAISTYAPETGGRPGVAVRVSIRRGKDLSYILMAGLDPQVFGRILANENLPSDWAGFLIDGDRAVVAATGDPATLRDRPGASLRRQTVEATAEDPLFAGPRNGIRSYSAVSKSPLSGWSVAIRVPASAIEGPLRHSLLYVSSFGVVLLVLGIVLAGIVSNATAGSIEALARMAENLGLGKTPAVHNAPTRIAEVQNLHAAFARASRLIQEHSEDLESRVAARTADLTRLNAELSESFAEREQLAEQLRQSQKMEAIGTLAGGVAHDFNNILAIIMGYAREMLSEDGDAAGGRSRSLEVILSAAGRGAKVVKQLLAFAAKPSMESKPVDANALVHETADIIKAVFPKTIAFELDLDPALPRILGDQNQLQQVLINLCLNARDAMGDEGTLSIRTSTAMDPELVEPLRGTGPGFIRLEVSDTGAGMDEETRRRIFEPFFTTKQPKGGTGLGLSVVYAIVQAHGGFIDVRSEKGRGAAFQVYLAAPSRVVGSLELEKASSKKIRGEGETILIVDDEVHLLDLLRAAAERRGFRALTAGDGIEALRVYQRHREDVALVVLDWGLPGLGGSAVFGKLKELNPRVNVIGLSGYLEPDVRDGMLGAGVRGFLQKPCTLDEILEKVSEFCRPDGRAPAA